jgi:DNA-binding transcriptional MerR regulator
MSFLPDLAPLTHKINEFTQQQNVNQQQIISLLKQTNLALSQIQKALQEINQKKLCLEC